MAGLPRRAPESFLKVLSRGGLALGIVLILSADLFFLSQHSVTTPVTFGQALQQFRTATTTTTTGAQAPGGPPPSVAASGPSAGRPSASPARPGAGASVPRPTPTTAPPSAPAFSAPAEGVYAYATHGFERISFGGARHDYPSETFATARRRPGCQWEFEQRVAKEHVETRLFCGEPGTFFFLQQTTQVTFYGQTNSSTVRCDPPEVTARTGDAPGSRREAVCQLDNGSQTAETVTYLGPATVPIEGADVAALHVLIEGRMSGNVQGTSRIELWLHPQTGLTLRSVSHVQSSAPAFGTRVDYEEDASYLLEHLAPAT